MVHRQGPIAVMADVEAMFHQVRVAHTDCDVLQFLWWPYGDITQEPQVHQLLVHLFGTTLSPSCANFAFRKTTENNAA